MPFSRKSRLVASSKSKQTSSEEETYLFVVKSSQATSYPTGPGTYQLNIPVSQSGTEIVAFSDRPFRDALVISDKEFVSYWDSASGFGKDPPNAVVDFLDPQTGKRESAIIVEITGAKLARNNQILQLTVTQGNFRRTDARLGNTLKPVMSCVSVFIDSGSLPCGPQAPDQNCSIGSVEGDAGSNHSCVFPAMYCGKLPDGKDDCRASCP